MQTRKTPTHGHQPQTCEALLSHTHLLLYLLRCAPGPPPPPRGVDVCGLALACRVCSLGLQRRGAIPKVTGRGRVLGHAACPVLTASLCQSRSTPGMPPHNRDDVMAAMCGTWVGEVSRGGRVNECECGWVAWWVVLPVCARRNGIRVVDAAQCKRVETGASCLVGCGEGWSGSSNFTCLRDGVSAAGRAPVPNAVLVA
jgi:hypothetical protein